MKMKDVDLKVANDHLRYPLTKALARNYHSAFHIAEDIRHRRAPSKQTLLSSGNYSPRRKVTYVKLVLLIDYCRDVCFRMPNGKPVIFRIRLSWECCLNESGNSILSSVANGYRFVWSHEQRFIHQSC
jgi:hypothetical protein